MICEYVNDMREITNVRETKGVLMKKIFSTTRSYAGLVITSLWATLLLVQPAAAKSGEWQFSFPDPVSPMARMMKEFHDLWLLPIVFGVSLFVLGLLVYTCYRFSAKRNPVPSKTTHNALLEVLWTAVPVVILAAMVFPSLRLLYATDYVEDSEMTLKITGYQWYWGYEYPDHGGFFFDSYLMARTAAEAEEYGVKRLLDTDNIVVLPVDTKIRLQITSGDVLHNWSLSEVGVRMDAVPGRLNETWTLFDTPGRYYGFCSELCGVDHAYMPIAIDAVSKEEFEAWVEEAKQEFASHRPKPADQSTGLASTR